MGFGLYLVNLDKRQADSLGELPEIFTHGGDPCYRSLTSLLQRRLAYPSQPLPNGGTCLKGLQAAIDAKLAGRRAEREIIKRHRPRKGELVKGGIWDVALHEREDDDTYRLRYILSVPR